MSSIHLTCLCGAIKAPFNSPFSSKSLFPTTFCHCNPCRQSTGGLYGEFPRLAEAPSAEVLAACTRYDAIGPRGIQRYFCTRCGTHVFGFDVRDSQWHGLGGAIETDGSEAIRDLVKVTGHIFVDETLDGGIVGGHPGLVKLRYDEEEKELPCYSRWSDEDPIPLTRIWDLAQKALSLAKLQERESLMAKCHCGGTDLRIKRANYVKEDQAVSASHIAPEKGKYPADFCVCRSCRLANGTASLLPWAAVPQSNITVAATGKKVVFGRPAMENGANDGTSMKHFWSSKNVCWSFCDTCGACLFNWNEGRPNAIKVTVGILRAEEGALARRWLSWRWGHVGYPEEAMDQEGLNAIIREKEAA